MKLMDKNNFGSEWLRWDLQVQPIKGEWLIDVQNKKKEIKASTNEYLKVAIEKQISVIAITDHNCGLAIDSAFELVESDCLNISVLPGVEVDVNLGFQILVVFNPEYKNKIKKQSWNEAVEHFLNNVCAIESPVINSNSQAKATSRDINDILEILCKEDIGIPIIAHVQNNKGLFKKTSAYNRKEFFDKILAKKYYSVFDHKSNEEIIQTEEILRGWELNSNIFSLIKSSDAHHASETGTVFTWIKSNPTYEGLKQIIYDPKSRISIEEQEPVKPTNIIDSITFNIPKDTTITVEQNNGAYKNEKFCFAGVKSTYYLSTYFSCFICGRGTGKSTILNFLGQYSNNPSSSEGFWEKIQPSINTKDFANFSFEGVQSFEFIGQNEVESFATNIEAFTNAIYERANLLNNEILSIHERKLSKLLNSIVSFKQLVEDLNKFILDKDSKEKEKKILENSIKLTESIKYKEIADKIKINSHNKQLLEEWRIKIDELRGAINILFQEYFSASSDEKEKVVEVKQREESIIREYQVAFEKVKENIESALQILNEKNFGKQKQDEDRLIQNISEEETELSKLLKEAGLSEENILQIKSAPQKTIQINNTLSRINEAIKLKNTELNNYKKILDNLKVARLDFEKAIKESIKPLISTLETQVKDNEKEDVKNIGLNYFFDEQLAWENIADEFYSYFSIKYKATEKSVHVKDYIIIHKKIFSSNHNKIKDLLLSEKQRKEYLKFLDTIFKEIYNFKVFETIRDKHLNDVSNYKRIQVLYDGKDIEQASFGQKCTAVMVILLLFGNYPLIIDEPEAHLDSSLIANYLVPLIKQKKNKRKTIDK